MDSFSTDALVSLLIGFTLIVIALIGFVLILLGLGYLFLLWYKNRGREQESLTSVLLQVAVPRENEIKIDAAEQLFSSLAAIKKSSKFNFFRRQPHVSFEIVGSPGDIRFFIHTPEKLRDLVEKQIHGAYPDADILVVDEKGAKLKKEMVIGNDYNIFSENGAVSYRSLKLKKEDYLPIKMYKDLPTDPLSAISSVLAKMTDGEGAAIQILISPADDNWKKAGKAYVAKTKKAEANPETAKYGADSKEFEGIESKVSKHGFETLIRIVVSSSSQEAADAHLANIIAAFSQFDGLNSFTKAKQWFGKSFLTDFIYRFMPIRGETSILSSEELATIFHFPNKSITTPNIFWLTAK